MGWVTALMNELIELPEETEPVLYENIREIQADIICDLEGFEGQDVIVMGNPFELAESLDSVQGDNIYHAASDCGLVSCSNYLNICGIQADEDEVVGFALENNLCGYSPYSDPYEWGGTNDYCLETILESYGVESTAYGPEDAHGTLEGIADAVEEGHAVMMGVNAGYLWDSPDAVGDGSVNHQITVTGTVRDASGELVALTICDSGRGLESDSCRVVSTEELEECYTQADYASVIISDSVVR